MLRFQGPKASAQLSGGGQRIHQHQSAGHLHHGEPNWNGHVIDALELLKAPYLAWDQFFNVGGALAIGIQRQQRPPRPALILRLDPVCSHSVHGSVRMILPSGGAMQLLRCNTPKTRPHRQTIQPSCTRFQKRGGRDVARAVNTMKINGLDRKAPPRRLGQAQRPMQRKVRNVPDASTAQG